MAIAMIQLNNLRRSFREGDRDHPVLEKLSMTVNAGETIALLGRSGSGKSTLLNIISGIDKPDSGTVTIDGIDLSAASERDCTLFRRRHIGFVYQFFNLIPTLTAEENIALVLELNSFSAADIRDRTRTIIEAVGLSRVKHKFPDQMSGGEQQRVAIARALVHAPKLVLADELTGNLDAETGQRVLSVLRELIAKNNTTLLMVTHSMAVAQTADRIITLDRGVLLEREKHFAW